MPRMRTIDEAFAYILGHDPETALTKTALRRLVVTGMVSSVKVGQKYLIDLDKLEAVLASGIAAATPLSEYGVIRHISE